MKAYFSSRVSSTGGNGVLRMTITVVMDPTNDTLAYKIMK